MQTGLAGKVVLITGATRNHGRASALAFAAQGAHLLLCTRQSMELLEETAHLAAPCGVKVVTSRCDVTDEAQVKTFVEKGLAEFGRIDVVVNNAGWRARGDLLRISTENWLATLAVNLHAPFLMSQAVLPSMVQTPLGTDHQLLGYLPLPWRQRRHGKNGRRRTDQGHCARVRPV